MFLVAGVPIEQYEQYARYVHNLDECCQLSSGDPKNSFEHKTLDKCFL